MSVKSHYWMWMNCAVTRGGFFLPDPSYMAPSKDEPRALLYFSLVFLAGSEPRNLPNRETSLLESETGQTFYCPAVNGGPSPNPYLFAYADRGSFPLTALVVSPRVGTLACKERSDEWLLVWVAARS